jgi:hypothetical protein
MPSKSMPARFAVKMKSGWNVTSDSKRLLEVVPGEDAFH